MELKNKKIESNSLSLGRNQELFHAQHMNGDK